jgi:hypothetical protein
MELAFASGALWGVPSGSNPTPSRIRQLQTAALDFTRTSDPLYSLNQMPNAVGVGVMKVTGKAMFAEIRGRLMNDLFFNGTSAAGQTVTALNEGPSAIPATPFQITVVNSATWTTDLGVINNANGVPMGRVTSSPAAGQYSVAAGVYTFSSADNVSGISVRFSYEYTIAATGQTLTLSNQAMGIGPTFKAVLKSTFNALDTTWQLNACVATKLAFSTQLDKFAKPDLEWDSYTDSTDTLGIISCAETN